MPRFSLRRNFGSAGSFNGTNNYVTLGSDVAALKITGSITLSAWVKASSFNQSADIISKYISATRQYRLAIVSPNIIRLDIAGANRVSPTAILTNSLWHHVVGVYTAGSSMDVYINGVLQNGTLAGSVPASMTDTTNIVTFGIESNLSNNPFNGQIDDVRIWNTALTAAQVSQVANSSQSTVNDVATANLVGWWKYDENTGTNVADSSASGNAGTWNGTLGSQWTTGVTFTARTVAGTRQLVRNFVTCLRFNGTSNNVKRAIVSTVSNNFTYMCWMKIDKIPAANAYAVFSGDNTANGFSLEVLTTGIIQGELVGIWPVPSAVKIDPGIWYYVVFRRNAGTSQMYINGVASGASAANGPLTPSGYTAVGCSLNGSGTGAANFFPGLVDDVRIYERALSATEITNLYYGQEPATTNLKLWWKFDEGSGTSATDSSGNGNTGTITGATYSSDVFMTSPRTVAGTRTVVP